MSKRRHSARLVGLLNGHQDIDMDPPQQKRKSTVRTRSDVDGELCVKDEPNPSLNANQSSSMAPTICVIPPQVDSFHQGQLGQPYIKPDTTVSQGDDSRTEAGPSQDGRKNAKPKRKSQAKPRATTCGTDEQRAARFRASCSGQTRDRFRRVMSQRMFLLDRNRSDEPSETFKVLGSTGNVYTVTISLIQSCDCPDACKGHVPCKHILFVMLKVLKVPEDSYLWYQKALLLKELQEIFTAAPVSPHASFSVSTSVKHHYHTLIGVSPQVVEESGVPQEESGEATRKVVSVGEDCPVCYEEMTEQDDFTGKLVYDESATGCGKGLHRQCFAMWAATTRAKGNDVTCVWCRAPWVEPAQVSSLEQGTSAGRTKLGYLNLAGVAGINRQRDVSSYYRGPMLGRPAWESQYRYLDD